MSLSLTFSCKGHKLILVATRDYPVMARTSSLPKLHENKYWAPMAIIIIITCPSGSNDDQYFISGISLSLVLIKFYLYFQSLLLFTNVIMDSAGIDYHVILAGNLFQQCLDNPGLQQELLCALCKQTSRIMTHSSKHGVQVKKQHSIKHTRVSHYFYLVSSFFCTTEYHSLP